MKSVEQLLAEMEKEKANLIESLTSFQKVLTDYIGTEVKPYGLTLGENYGKIEDGREYLFCTPDRRAWGLGYIGKKFVSISVWKKGNFRFGFTYEHGPIFSEADSILNFEEVSPDKLGPHIKEFLLNPKAGKYSLKNDKMIKQDSGNTQVPRLIAKD